MIDELELVLNKNSDMVAYHYEDNIITYKELLEKHYVFKSEILEFCEKNQIKSNESSYNTDSKNTITVNRVIW